MTQYRHDTLAQTVLVGIGQTRELLAQAVADRGARRVLMIVDRPDERTSRLAEELPVVASIDRVRQHVPIEDAQSARALAEQSEADVVCSIGGGSATGLAKAIALTHGLPIVAVPTTYAGSEATPVWGITEQSRKTTGVDPVVLPSAVVYDAELVRSLPTELAVASGLNAIAHAVDAMWAPRTEPFARADAESGLRITAATLPRLLDDPADADLQELLVGAYLCARAFAATGSGMHHKICHALGGRFDLPHAPLHAVLLPHVMAYNAPEAPEADRIVARALAAPSAVEGLRALAESTHAPDSLAAIGLAESDVPEAIELAVAAVPPTNPRAADPTVLAEMISSAWAGRVPQERTP